LDVRATRDPFVESLARNVATGGRLVELLVLAERGGAMMRLCVNAIGEAVNTTAAAQQRKAVIRPRTRGNEDWLAVLMNWGGVK
jgi:hypothetical protein